MEPSGRVNQCTSIPNSSNGLMLAKKIHQAYEAAMVDAGINPFRVLCPVCRSCKICGIKNMNPNQPTEDTPYLLQSPQRKLSRNPPHNEESLPPMIQHLQDQLTSALARIDTLSKLNFQAYADLAEEKNKISKYELKYEQLRREHTLLQQQEQIYIEKITKLEASLKLAEACRSQTTKEMKKSKLELQSLRREINDIKCQNSLSSIEKNMRNILEVEAKPPADQEKSQQILLTVQNDIKELIQLISQWNNSLESVFMTQPNHEQEWLGLLSGLCRSLVERIEIVQNLLLHSR